jgi:hypothetical protein
MSLLAVAQNTRLVQGVVYNEADDPMEGVTLSSVDFPASCVTGENGTFQLYVSPYAQNIQASMEGFISQTVEIDGSYMVLKLKVDREYVRRKVLAEAAARQAADQEVAAKAKAEEEARLAAEREAATMAYAEQKKYYSWSAEESAQPSINSPKRRYRFVSLGVPMLHGGTGHPFSYTEGVFNKKGNIFLGRGLDYTSISHTEEGDKPDWEKESSEEKQIGIYGNGKLFFSTNRFRPFISLSLGVSWKQISRYEYGVGDSNYAGLGLYSKAEIGLLVNILNSFGVYTSFDCKNLGDFFSLNFGVTF